MTQKEAIEEAKKIAASIPATKDNPDITVRIPDENSPTSSFWTVRFRQEEYAEMDDRGYWMEGIRWELESFIR